LLQANGSKVRVETDGWTDKETDAIGLPPELKHLVNMNIIEIITAGQCSSVILYSLWVKPTNTVPIIPECCHL